jgi:hypothetical protein
MPNEKILFSARVHPAVFLPSPLAFLFFIGSFVYTMILGSRADVSSGLMAGLFFIGTLTWTGEHGRGVIVRRSSPLFEGRKQI